MTNSLQKFAIQHEIVPGLAFGIDVGIASCGWAAVDTRNEKILAMGSRCFDPSEDPQTKTLTNANRREKRGARRVMARRSSRMSQVRKAIRNSGMSLDPSPEYFQSLGENAPDAWEARAQGLKRILTADEAAAALIHIAKHRGFKSNSKSEAKDTEGRKVLSAIDEAKKKRGERTYGQWLHEDHQNQKRNKDGEYNFMPLRDSLLEEARRIIRTQRRLGADWTTEEFEKDYIGTAFHQRPLQSSEKLLGRCPFEQWEKRPAKHGYSFVRFRLIQSLVHRGKIITDEGERDLNPLELQKALKNFGKNKGLTYKRLRGLINPTPDYKFAAAPNDEDEKRDVTGSSAGASPGSYALRKCLGDPIWNRLTKESRKLDRIAEIITFNESPDRIRNGLSGFIREPETVDKIMCAVERGDFARFKGVGNISAKAACKLIPELMRGKVYSEACETVSYDHAAVQQIQLDNIKNPVVKRAAMQAIKQVEVMIRKFGRPERINIELLREVGKSAEERGKITRGINRRTAERSKNETEFLECVGRKSCSRTQIEMYELLKEQAYRCPYCDDYLNPSFIVAQNTAVQIDHIYPRSRSHDNSFVNKVLACIKCNQQKRQRTPWEWQGKSDRDWWAGFEARVSKMTCKREKKRHLLSKVFADREQEFIERNKVDSSYVARTLMNELMWLYPESYQGGKIISGAKRRLFARPGQITAMMRRAWLGPYKKKREDDRHHAMDALIVALVDDEFLLQRLTKAYQHLEERGMHKFTPNVNPPWDGFDRDAIDAYDSDWLVCRTESRRVRGAIHEETIRRMRRDENGKEIYYERKAVDALTKSDINRIPDPVTQSIVREWFDKGKPKDAPPKSAAGDVIRKLRLPTKIKTARQINPHTMGGKNPERQGGYVENSSMVRVDVFRVNKTKYDINTRRVTPGYYLVPVYGADIVGKDSETPLKAIVGAKGEDVWPVMEPDDFVMSLYKDSYIEFQRSNGKNVAGYYRSTGRATASISVSPHDRRELKDMIQSIGVKGLEVIEKFHIDRLGNKHKIVAETWPGKLQAK